MDGKGYYADVTWGLCEPDMNGRWTMRYLFETDDEREEDGADKESIRVALLDYWKPGYDHSRFAVTDETYVFLHNGQTFSGLDTQKKVIRYTAAAGEQEFSYTGE